MNPSPFSYPITIRYSDLDPQGHVNNAAYLSYFEHGRIHYLLHLGLFRQELSFQEIGIIVAKAEITYLHPILFGQDVRIGVRTKHLGHKSIIMHYRLFSAKTDLEFATGETVLVAYDYHTQQTIPVPPAWRDAMTRFEHLT